MANETIRQKMKENKVYLWQIGYKIGVTEMTIIRWLRLPLDKQKEKRLAAAIDEIIAKRKEVAENE